MLSSQIVALTKDEQGTARIPDPHGVGYSPLVSTDGDCIVLSLGGNGGPTPEMSWAEFADTLELMGDLEVMVRLDGYPTLYRTEPSSQWPIVVGDPL